MAPRARALLDGSEMGNAEKVRAGLVFPAAWKGQPCLGLIYHSTLACDGWECCLLANRALRQLFSSALTAWLKQMLALIGADHQPAGRQELSETRPSLNPLFPSRKILVRRCLVQRSLPTD